MATLNSDQQEAFENLQDFIGHSIADTFVLKGYAGTGKTFLMQFLATWLKESNQEFRMLASTGRAAAILRGKTGFEAKTVHGELYKFSQVNGDHEGISDDAPSDKFGQMTLQFTLKPSDGEERIYIVDEASMLSSDFIDNDSDAVFGSGVLLDDFFESIGKNKVIFVGDPCQLPPIGQIFSPALDIDWLVENKRKVLTSTLTKIERTNSDNDILKLAHRVRDLSQEKPIEKFSKLPARGLAQVSLHESDNDLLLQYISTYQKNDLSVALAVARSNKMVQAINKEVRKNIHGEYNMPLQIGDVLLVTQNNFLVPLTNGDFAVVISIDETKTHAGLHFQKITVRTALSEKEYDILLSLDILYGERTSFTKEQSKNLMVEFSKKMRKKDIKPNSEKYKKAMMEDEYLNCLKATYGYAVTCHKSQGGEWDNVFLFLEKSMYGMSYVELHRWWYTAITRTKKKIELVDNWWISNFVNQ